MPAETDIVVPDGAANRLRESICSSTPQEMDFRGKSTPGVDLSLAGYAGHLYPWKGVNAWKVVQAQVAQKQICLAHLSHEDYYQPLIEEPSL